MKRRLSIMVFASILAFAFAGISGSSCGISRKIWTINGIWTDEKGALRNMEKLRETYGTSFAGQPVAYNSQSFSETVSLWLPSGSETVTLAAASAFLPSIYMGTNIVTENGRILP